MDSVAEAFDRVPREKAAAYAPISGDPAFLEAVVRDVLGDGELASQAIAVATPGGTGAVQSAVMNFLEPGMAALAPDYYWSSYRVITSHAGRSLDTFPMFDEEGRFDIGAFERALDEQLERQGRALILFNFPCNNPTGYSLDEDEWARVAAIVRSAGERAPVTFLIDHAYARFAADADVWRAHAPTMLETATVLVAWTASKSFAQYGARIGALLALHADPDERERLKAALGYSCRGTWSNCNHLGILAITELLTDDDLRRRSLEERAGLVRLLDDRVRAFNESARAAGLRYPRYEGGFFVSVFTPDSERTADVMRRTGVYVVPMRGAVRVALCATPLAEVERLTDALAEGMRAG
jgi:aromatic-amino-acid transaminase